LAFPAAGAWGLEGLVVTVFDGDTVEIALDDGRTEKVRYLLVDSPELHHPTRKVEEFGLEAAIVNRALVLGKRVRLETDIQQRDRYGRLLAYVWLDGPSGAVLASEVMVEEGFALPLTLPPNVRHAGRIHAALVRARKGAKGFWNAAAGRLFTPKQVWADLPLLAGVYLTLDIRADEVTRQGRRWTISEKGVPTRLVVYENQEGLFGSVPALRGSRLRVIGKVQASFQGAEILLADPAQVISVTRDPKNRQ